MVQALELLLQAHQPILAVGEQKARAYWCPGPSVAVGDGDVATWQLQRTGRCLTQGDQWLERECRIKRSEPQARCNFWNLTVTVCSLLPRMSQVQLTGEPRLSRLRGLCKVPCTSKSRAGGSSQAGLGKRIRSG